MLDDSIVEVLPLPFGTALEEILDVVRTEVVGCVQSEQRYPLSFTAHPEVREDESLVSIHVVAVDLMQSVELRHCKTGFVLAGCTKKEIRVEVACLGIGDDGIDYAVRSIALTHYFSSDDGEESRRNVVGGSVGQVVTSDFGCPGLKVVGPPSGCSSYYTIKVIREELKVAKTLS